MVTVDSKGRVVLPKEVRDELDIEPGSEVEIREEGGRVVMDPETDPESIVERMDALLETASLEPGGTPADELDPYARDHAETIRRQAESADSDDE